MEPKPESLWWTTTFKHEDMTTLRVRSRQSLGIFPFREIVEVLRYCYHRDGKEFQGVERTMCKGMGSWRDKYIYRLKTVPMANKCKRVHSHVYSTVLNGSTNWPWSGAMINKVRALESEDTTSHFQASHEARRILSGLQNEENTKILGGDGLCRC